MGGRALGFCRGPDPQQAQGPLPRRLLDTAPWEPSVLAWACVYTAQTPFPKSTLGFLPVFC